MLRLCVASPRLHRVGSGLRTDRECLMKSGPGSGKDARLKAVALPDTLSPLPDTR